MRKNYAFLILAIIFTAGCSKPDPNPELKDPIYLDMVADLSSAGQQLEAERALLKSHQQEADEAPPQTGKIKFALKRISESTVKIQQLEQEKIYLELKVESRKAFSRSTYQKAFSAKQPWPDPRDWELYSAEKRLRTAKKEWDVKQRIKELAIENDQVSPAPKTK